MTRETKIGLLVGLAFIIVIGILLSDHMTHSTEPAPAPISTVGPSVRTGVNVAAAPAPQESPVKPGAVIPASPVPTAAELNPPAPKPVVVIGAPAAPSGNQLVASYPNDLKPAAPAPAAPAARSYKAAPGDSLSRMAARFYGADTLANRDRIIHANSSLIDDPDMIIAGKTYTIPAAAAAAPIAAPAAAPTGPAIAASPTPAPASAQRLYVVKSGDTLWGIASEQLGTGTAASSIAELNKELLKGSTTIRQGMQLRLPPTVND